MIGATDVERMCAVDIAVSQNGGVSSAVLFVMNVFVYYR